MTTQFLRFRRTLKLAALVVLLAVSVGSAQSIASWLSDVDRLQLRGMTMINDLSDIRLDYVRSTGRSTSTFTFSASIIGRELGEDLFALLNDIQSVNRQGIQHLERAMDQNNETEYQLLAASNRMLQTLANSLLSAMGGATSETFDIQTELFGVWGSLRDVWRIQWLR